MHLHNPFEDREGTGRERNLLGIGGTGGGLSLDIGGSDPLGQAFSTIFGSPSRGGSQQRIQEFAPTETAQSISQLLQGIFGGAGEIPGQIGGLIGQQPQQIGQGAIGQQLQGALTDPSFGVSQAQQGLLDEIMSQTQGASAVRGLGPATQGGLARAIAPSLAGFRQQRIGNLLGGAGLEQQAGQFGAGLGEQARGTSLQALLQQLGLGTQGLTTAAGLMQPERITLGSRQETGGSPGIFGQLFGGSGGSAAGEFGGITGLF